MLRAHSVAIRICCSAKLEFEDESVIFSNVFPNIPLLGFHADGEIGWNSFGATEDIGKTLVNNSRGGQLAQKCTQITKSCNLPDI